MQLLIKIFVLIALCLNLGASALESCDSDFDELGHEFHDENDRSVFLVTVTDSAAEASQDPHAAKHSCHNGVCHFGHCAHGQLQNRDFKQPRALSALAPVQSLYSFSLSFDYRAFLERPPMTA